LTGEVGALRSELRRLGRLGSLVGASPAMQRVYDVIERVATSDARVLITGDTGTGKELIAHAIHTHSRRRSRPFVAVNCGAISANLIESELFGHERGSFTGADRQHKGHFEQAHEGTLFLDEVTEMPMDLQVRLLRVLEASALTRVGGTTPVTIDVRVLAASNFPIAQAVAAGKLRQDLLYRLNVIGIQVPPLRERGDDVVLLAEHFLSELNTAAGLRRRFTEGSLDRLREHAWPGNVRELKNVVERAYVLTDGEVDVEVASSPELDPASAPPNGVGSSLGESERQLILATLDHFSGDKRKAAAMLKISLNTLYSRLREYKLD
ncbi:MAG TPA: sigma-54 dependent transcriptional regulator, partial [Vicinamibacteria bacterium]|nr:sigma-54 dependent transcriptional regulator [Vicinamibacteria bacterium]